jgi:hypothetical protein
MNSTTVAVDLAKSVFQLAVADSSWKIADNFSGSFAAACSDWHFSDADSFGATGHS